MNNQTNYAAISDADLDMVVGGFSFSSLGAAITRAARSTATPGPCSTGGGQSDPAQMFQQIMQQLTGQ